MAELAHHSPPPHLVIADDATGAVEAGVLLAEAFGEAAVDLDFETQAAPRVQARVLLVPTRHLAPEDACRLLRKALPACVGASLFFKTDSTLRGPIGACFRALLDAFPGHGLIYIPAYPALGRIVRGGVVFVHGRPLAETEFGADPRNPVRSSSVLDLLEDSAGCRFQHAATPGRLRQLLAGESRPVAVCDASTEEEVSQLAAIAGRSARPLLLAGPAGCVRYWAGGAPRPRHRGLPPVARWLVVCGSRHPVSRRQAAAARQAGLEVVSSPEPLSPDPAAEEAKLAQAAASSAADGLIVFGGDTALALWQALGVRRLQPLFEIFPGVAVSRAGRWVFVTKAGGFGPLSLAEDILKVWNP